MRGGEGNALGSCIVKSLFISFRHGALWLHRAIECTSKVTGEDVAVGPQKSKGLSVMERKGDAQLLQRQLDEIDVCQNQHDTYRNRCVDCVLQLCLCLMSQAYLG